jgi:phage tail-like protein
MPPTPAGPFLRGHFRVAIEGVAELQFAEVILPEASTEVIEIRNGGEPLNAHKIPRSMHFGNLVLRRGLTRSDDLFAWWAQIAGGVTDRRDVTITLLNDQLQPVKQWIFSKVWPAKYYVSPLVAEDASTPLVETIECATEGFRLGYFWRLRPVVTEATATMSVSIREEIAKTAERARSALAHDENATFSVMLLGEARERMMATEIMATGQEAEVFRVDLSAMTAKYVDETETHLDELFAEAERTGAVLYFDEADALFGKRSPIKETGGRCTDPMIERLLEKAGAHHGLVVWGSSAAYGSQRSRLPQADSVLQLRKKRPTSTKEQQAV